MNFSAIVAAPLAIQIHLYLVLLAIVLGLSQFCLKKGTWRHKIIGYVVVAFVAMLAIASFFIKEVFPQLGLGWVFFGYSPIHLLSLYVLYALTKSILAIKHGDVKTHEQTMKRLFFVGFLIAGAFALTPGRLLFRVLFGG